MEVFKASPRDRAPTADCGADFVVSLQLPHGRGGGARGGLHGISQGQGLNSVFVKQNMSTFQFLTVVESWGDGVFFRPSSAGAADEGPAVSWAVVWGKAGSTGYDAPCGSSSRGKAGFYW